MTDLSMHRSSYHFRQRYEIVRHTIPREEEYQAAKKERIVAFRESIDIPESDTLMESTAPS